MLKEDLVPVFRLETHIIRRLRSFELDIIKVKLVCRLFQIFLMARRERARVNTGTYTSCVAELVVVVVGDVVVDWGVISVTLGGLVSADTCNNIVSTLTQTFNKSDVKPDVMIKRRKKIGIVMFLFRKLLSLCLSLYLH